MITIHRQQFSGCFFYFNSIFFFDFLFLIRSHFVVFGYFFVVCPLSQETSIKIIFYTSNCALFYLSICSGTHTLCVFLRMFASKAKRIVWSKFKCTISINSSPVFGECLESFISRLNCYKMRFERLLARVH